MLRILFFALLLASTSYAFRHRNGNIRLRTPKDQRVAATSISESAKVNQVFGAFSKKMGNLYMLHRREEGGEDVLQMPQGMSISLQDPDDLITPLMKKLDKKCGQRFEQTLKGDAKGMHALDLGSKTLKKDCEKEFKGKLCGTKATIRTQHTDSGTDNEVKGRFVMDGDSCVPEECVSSKNLAALAEFMRGRAQTLGEEVGNDLEISLAVDCSKHEEERGGSVISPKSSAMKLSVPSALLLVAFVAYFAF